MDIQAAKARVVILAAKARDYSQFPSINKMSGDWAVLADSLDDGVAALEALEEAQAELSAWRQEFTVTLDDESRTQYQMDALEAGKMVQDVEAEARMAKHDLEEAKAYTKELEDYREFWIARNDKAEVERDEVQGELEDVRRALDKDTERLSLWFSVDRILKEGK